MDINTSAQFTPQRMPELLGFESEFLARLKPEQISILLRGAVRANQLVHHEDHAGDEDRFNEIQSISSTVRQRDFDWDALLSQLHQLTPIESALRGLDADLIKFREENAKLSHCLVGLLESGAPGVLRNGVSVLRNVRIRLERFIVPTGEQIHAHSATVIGEKPKWLSAALKDVQEQLTGESPSMLDTTTSVLYCEREIIIDETGALSISACGTTKRLPRRYVLGIADYETSDTDILHVPFTESLAPALSWEVRRDKEIHKWFEVESKGYLPNYLEPCLHAGRQSRDGKVFHATLITYQVSTGGEIRLFDEGTIKWIEYAGGRLEAPKARKTPKCTGRSAAPPDLLPEEGVNIVKNLVVETRNRKLDCAELLRRVTQLTARSDLRVAIYSSWEVLGELIHLLDELLDERGGYTKASPIAEAVHGKPLHDIPHLLPRAVVRRITERERFDPTDLTQLCAYIRRDCPQVLADNEVHRALEELVRREVQKKDHRELLEPVCLALGIETAVIDDQIAMIISAAEVSFPALYSAMTLLTNVTAYYSFWRRPGLATKGQQFASLLFEYHLGVAEKGLHQLEALHLPAYDLTRAVISSIERNPSVHPTTLYCSLEWHIAPLTGGTLREFMSLPVVRQTYEDRYRAEITYASVDRLYAQAQRFGIAEIFRHVAGELLATLEQTGKSPGLVKKLREILKP